MSNHRVLDFAFVVLCLGTSCTSGTAATWTVGQPNTNCPNIQYNTISQAITAARPGDEIDICPALYAEQILITKPLTLKGLTINNVNRTLVQPSVLTPLSGLPAEAVITVMNTQGVNIQNLAIDASNNTVSGCDTFVSGIHFYNSSGTIGNSAVSGAQLKDPTSCSALTPGNGFDVEVESTQCTGCIGSTPPDLYHVTITGNDLHDYTRSGVYATGSGITVDVQNNSITGLGPATGTFQFAIYLVSGPVGRITGNAIAEGGSAAHYPTRIAAQYEAKTSP